MFIPSGSTLGSALARSLSLFRALANPVPECFLGHAFAFLDALPGTVEQYLKARRTTQHDPFKIVVIVRNKEHGNGLAVPRNDDRAFGAAFV
jgi:hypothetical protein